MQFWLSMIVMVATPFVGLWAFSDSLPFQEEVTTYTALCGGEFKDGKCKSKEQALSNHTYKPIVDKQMVVHWGENGVPERYDQCAVRNVRSWACEEAFGSAVMIDGNYRDRSSDVFYQVPKWYWWWLKLGAKAAPNPQQK